MKGVILAAGYGTRFLPGSKTIPKEMFPLIDTPAIDLIVRELEEAGIRDVLVVTSRRKKALEDYFDREVELEGTFRAEGSEAKQKLIEPTGMKLFFLRQRHMAGTADALLQVEPFVGNEPFVVAYPDDILLKGPSLAGQLLELHRRTGKMVLAAQELPEGDVSRYGVIDSYEQDGVELARAMVEKPAPGSEPSRLVCYGRYVYTPEIFPALKSIQPKRQGGGEFTQTEVVNQLAEAGQIAVKRFDGMLIDVGTPQGYLHAVVEYGLYREEFREGLLNYLENVLAREGRG